MKNKKPSPARKSGVFKCSSCGVVYNAQKGNFLVSSSPLFAGNGGHTTMCRTCIDELYRKMLGFFDGNAQQAIEYCCRMFDWYYNDAIVAATAKEATVSRVLIYPSKLNMIQFKAAGKTYLDTLIERKSKPANHIVEANEMVEGEDIDDVYRPSPETIRFFGNGYTNEDYEFLQSQYDDWTTRYECNTKAQEELFNNSWVSVLF